MEGQAIGNLSQHIQWSAIVLCYLLIAVIYWLLGDNATAKIIPIPILFIIGSVMPDVDLKIDRWWRKAWFYITMPVVGYIISKRSMHWGRIHSIGFGIIYSFFLFGIFLLCQIGINYSFILSFSFGIGFLFHLICDQFYHTLRGKGGKRVALKLWSNGWRYDPLVWLFKR